MSRYTELFEYLRTCPTLAELWSVGASEEIGVNEILPQGTSSAVRYEDFIDSTGAYQCEMIPYPSVYEDYQINCYRAYDAYDASSPADNINVMSLDDVQAVCDWISAQNERGNLPKLSGKTVVSVECSPFIPQIRYINAAKNLAAYFITLRVRYVNPTARKAVEYALKT